MKTQAYNTGGLSEITSSQNNSQSEMYGEEDGDPDPNKLRIPVSNIIMAFNKPTKYQNQQRLVVVEDHDTLDLNQSIDEQKETFSVTPKNFENTQKLPPIMKIEDGSLPVTQPIHPSDISATSSKINQAVAIDYANGLETKFSHFKNPTQDQHSLEALMAN